MDKRYEKNAMKQSIVLQVGSQIEHSVLGQNDYFTEMSETFKPFIVNHYNRLIDYCETKRYLAKRPQ